MRAPNAYENTQKDGPWLLRLALGGRGLARLLGLSGGRAITLGGSSRGRLVRARSRSGGSGWLPRVVGHVPAAALELDGGRREQAFELAPTFLTGPERPVRKLLNLLDVRATFAASILVER